jgi:cellobiose phosphorylase/cellobionic acid phosphorylase
MKPLMTTIESLETPFGPHITYPPYTKWNPRVGRISLKRPGTTENGSVYCHGAMFAAYAYCLRKMGSKAYDIVRRTLPTNPENPPEKNLQVPLFVPNYYFALPGTPDFGLSSRVYETGTCPWLIWVVIEHLLGVRATTHGLLIDPALPDEWEECGLSRRFREARYDITYRRGASTPGMRIIVDGRITGQALLPYEAGRKYLVEVVLNETRRQPESGARSRCTAPASR